MCIHFRPSLTSLCEGGAVNLTIETDHVRHMRQRIYNRLIDDEAA
jgi:hypothetical protein